MSNNAVTRLSKDADAKRKELTDTIDLIREQVVETGHRLSPDHLKNEAKQYFTSKGNSWLESVEQTAREHPLQAIAVGAGIAYPALSLIKAIPKPLLAIGAGLALLRYKQETTHALVGAYRDTANVVTDRATQAADSSMTALATVREQVADRLGQVSNSLGVAGSAIKDRAQTTMSGASESVGNVVGAANTMASNAGDVIRSALNQGASASADMGRDTGNFVRTIPGTAASAVRENLYVVTGVGLAIGAILAAAIPASETEERVLGPIGSNLREHAHDLVDQGLETASAAAGDLFDRAVDAAESQGLNVETAHRALSEVSDRVERVVNTATGSSPDTSSKPSNEETASPEFKS